MEANVFTSTGIKLMHHPVAVERFKDHRIATPISVQIAPTSKCNLNCCFCSNANRTQHEDLEIGQIKDLLYRLKTKGAKTVEWTGGGDPTMYRDICAAIYTGASLGLKQGFITNGVKLKDALDPYLMMRLHWIRISMNCLDYVDAVDLPRLQGRQTLGFSYVMNSMTNEDVLRRLNDHVQKYAPGYVRIVPDCRATTEEQEENNAKYAAMIEGWGKPYFYQAKIFMRPKRCWWAFFKPFILHDGWVYPCSSVVLNSDSAGKFHEKYRWVRVENLPDLYNEPARSISTENCDHCVFDLQNQALDMLAFPRGMEDFI